MLKYFCCFYIVSDVCRDDEQEKGLVGHAANFRSTFCTNAHRAHDISISVVIAVHICTIFPRPYPYHHDFIRGKLWIKSRKISLEIGIGHYISIVVNQFLVQRLIYNLFKLLRRRHKWREQVLISYYLCDGAI